MKKFIAALLVLAMLMATVAFAANVLFTGSAYVYKKMIRTKANRTNVVIKKGTVMEGTRGKTWTTITLEDGSEGYVPNDYTKDAGPKTPEDAPVIYGAGGYKKSTADSKTGTTTAKKIRATGRVNIRDAAHLSSKVLGTLERGKTLPATGKTKFDSRGVEFYEVTYKGKTAYVASGYSEPVK